MLFNRLKNFLKGLLIVLVFLNAAQFAPASDGSINRTRGCVEHYDPRIDYFPEKADLIYAQGFTLEYFRHYKVLTVRNPWPGAKVTFRYVLVQCGTPVPKGFENTEIIRIPVKTVATMSTAHLAHLELLGELDSLIAVSSLDRVYSPAVQRKGAAGELAEMGWGSHINVELLLDKAPDLVMAVGYNQPQFNVHPILQKAGIPVVLNAEYMEPSLLGQTEWLKFTAAFFNKDGLAQRLFNNIVDRYRTYADLARRIPDEQRPTVFSGTLHGDTWYVSGGKSYIAQLLKAAGGRYIWAEDDSRGSFPVSTEVVFERAMAADDWLTTHSGWRTRRDMLAADTRYSALQAFQEGKIYNNNARVSAASGNDYWETGMVEPHRILADLIKILHPQLLPEYTLKYFRQLK